MPFFSSGGGEAIDNNTLQRNAQGELYSTAGKWQFVEEIELSALGQTIEFTTVLDGDIDKEYRIDFILEPNVSTGTTVLMLNGATAESTSHDTYENFVNNAPAGTGVQLARSSNSSGLSVIGSFYLLLANTTTLFDRGFRSEAVYRGAEMVHNFGKITTPNNATNITSIGIDSSVANGFKAGSRARLYKRA